jgi:hypothetical protein
MMGLKICLGAIYFMKRGVIVPHEEESCTYLSQCIVWRRKATYQHDFKRKKVTLIGDAFRHSNNVSNKEKMGYVSLQPVLIIGPQGCQDDPDVIDSSPQ